MHRTVLTTEMANWRIDLDVDQATLGKDSAPHVVNVALKSVRDHQPPKHIAVLHTLKFKDLRLADEQLTSIEAESCVDSSGRRAALRLYGQGVPTEPPDRWRILYAFRSRVVLSADAVTADSCSEAFAAVPDVDPWLVQTLESQANPMDDPTLLYRPGDPLSAAQRVARGLNGLEAFAVALEDGNNLFEALDFTLRRRTESWKDSLLLFGSESWTDAGDWMNALRPAHDKIVHLVHAGSRGNPDLEGHLIRRLLPTRVQPPLSAEPALTPWVLELLGAAPSTDRKLAFAKEALNVCLQDDRVAECLPWRLEAMATVLRAQNDPMLCDEALEIASMALTGATRRAEATATAIVRGIGDCGSPAARDHLLLLALTPPLSASDPRAPVESACASANTLVRCQSLPMVAAHALARNCSDRITGAARTALQLPAIESNRPSRAASLCLLARCEGAQAFQKAYNPAEWTTEPRPDQLCGNPDPHASIN